MGKNGKGTAEVTSRQGCILSDGAGAMGAAVFGGWTAGD